MTSLPAIGAVIVALVALGDSKSDSHNDDGDHWFASSRQAAIRDDAPDD